MRKKIKQNNNFLAKLILMLITEILFCGSKAQVLNLLWIFLLCIFTEKMFEHDWITSKKKTDTNPD